MSGDEPLLVTEAVDVLRASARNAGYTDRLSMVMDARSDWSSVTAATQSVSLFGDRRILEIKIPTGKPGKAGADTLARLAEQAEKQADPDTLVLIALPRLDKATRESRWVQALSRGGIMVDIANIERGRLPAWIGMRLARQNQRADNATLQWMADKVEGNLLAAHQEIQKLGLLYPEGQLASEDVERAVLNVARYDVFGLRDAMLAGDTGRTIRMIDGLRRRAGAAAGAVAVGEEIRLLARVAGSAPLGQDVNGLMRPPAHFRRARTPGPTGPGQGAAGRLARRSPTRPRGGPADQGFVRAWAPVRSLGRNDAARAARRRRRRATVKAA